jgi:hypothetical protein
MADLSTLNPSQKEVYNTYIANDIPEEDAFGLVSGTVTQEDYFNKLDSQVKPKNEEEEAEQLGYDVNLMKSTGSVLKERAAASEGIQDISPEDTFKRSGPTQEEVFNLRGIRTDVDKEAPGSIRTALSFALPNESLQLIEGKNLLKKYLVNEKGIKPDLVEKFKDKIEFRYEPVGKGTDQEMNALVYKIPKELGGDGMFYAYNSPKQRPTMGDVKAIAGDAIPVASAITGGTIGSLGGIVGTTLGSAGGTFAGELTKLYIGRNVYGLHADMKEEDFDKAALETAALSASIDLFATPALLGIAQVIKRSVLTGAKEKLSSDTIKKFIASGGKIAPEITDALEEAKQVLIKAGASEKEASEWAAISVANAIPEAGIFPKGSEADIVYSKILNDANKKAKTLQIERKIARTLTGLDNIPEKEADEIIDATGNKIKQLRQDELIATDANVADAFANLQRTKKDFYKDPVTSDIDSIAVTFNDVNQQIASQISNTKTKLIKAAKNNNIIVDLDTRESVRVFNNILKDYSTKVKKKLPKKFDLKTATQAEREAYNSAKAVNEFIDLLQIEGKTDLIQKQLKTIKKGATNLDPMTYDEAVTIRAFIRQAEASPNFPVPVLNALRKLKGDFNTAITKATGGNKETAKLAKEYEELLFNYRNTFLEKLSSEVGRGSSSRVTPNVKLLGKNRNVFNSFMDDTEQGLINAEKLGNLINLKQFNTNQTNKVTNALYENYYNKVFPKAIGETSEMTHKQFIDKYGDNYRLILGDKKYNEFAKSNKAALNQFQQSVDKQVKIQNKVSEYLPGINIETLNTGNPEAIVKEIFRVGKNSDITGLIKSINKLDPQLTTDIRRIYLRQFLKNVTVDVETRAGGTLEGIPLIGRAGTRGEAARGLNGEALNNFIDNNRGVLQQLYGDNFVSAYRTLGRALEAIQAPLKLGKTGAPGLTEAANKAGLFVDIFAGPLNHKRLILNRIARIHDGFDLGGDSLDLLMDYDKFVEAAKKSFLGESYPLILDTLSKSKKPADKRLLVKLTKALGLNPKFSGYSFNLLKNPLTTKEYLKENITEGGRYVLGKPDTELEGQPGVFTPIDEVINKVVGSKGDTLAKYLDKKITPKVKKLFNMLLSGKEFQEKDFMREEFEKKLAK